METISDHNMDSGTPFCACYDTRIPPSAVSQCGNAPQEGPQHTPSVLMHTVPSHKTLLSGEDTGTNSFLGHKVGLGGTVMHPSEKTMREPRNGNTEVHMEPWALFCSIFFGWCMSAGPVTYAE